ncbi:amidase signature enzyme [Phanerochaete sordida]|uniref:amidase n=1 Tax=Phanerochaete sordida TaxID=48140 RepID=A0A9P3LE22_9APHY|nr:amidase signature enzyme [Phanerochaete sordida]
MWPFSSSSWKAVAQQKVDERAKALQTALPTSPEQSVFLVASASEIVKRIEAGEWTASEVLEAYISRAALAQQTTNCLTEVLFDEARVHAQALDEHMRCTKKLKGPLHGVPVSFKDIFDISGYDSSMGHTSEAHKPAQEDAELVRLVREAGGIPFVKTNVPQTLMFFECVNPTWGRTLNPYSADHTSGGSSGGEGALLAMDGSALGWGSDIGGSLRIPASFCGIYSLKPGHGRLSTGGAKENMPGFDAVKTVVGPMGRSVADIELACRVGFGQESENYDPAPIPYRNVKLREKLKFGYYVNDGFIRSSPASRRAVLETVEALRREGHECVEFAIPDMLKAINIFLSLTLADGNKTLFSPIRQDPRQPELTTMAIGPEMYDWTRSLITWALRNVMGDAAIADIMSACKPTTVNEFWSVIDQQKAFIRKINKEVWEKYEFDGIIAPVLPIPPLPHQSVMYIASIACASFFYNVADSPVGTVPVTRVNPELDGLTDEWRNQPIVSSPMLEGLLYKGDKAIYNVEKMSGLPVGVQVVGRKWGEEKVVEMMKVVDGALGKRGFGPGCWEAKA